ncbi:hypothetical protein [Erythrobacter donghaensis]|uniref:hypothetical protein n=1 Tax=Erythrobacter donghaensis TaxID=267135 RepID=UPI001B804565|nr:hypothetical protein [Erythrobacter donghaensis]
MRNLRRTSLSPTGLGETRGPAVSAGRRRWLLVALLAAVALLVLAWFDGGEEPLHPIAQDVALPELQP